MASTDDRAVASTHERAVQPPASKPTQASPTQASTPTIVWRPQEGPQKALVDCPLAEVFFGGARGGGKTDGVLGKWALKEKRYRDDIAAITRRINGGTNGLAGRKAWLAKACRLFGDIPVERPQSTDEIRALQSDLAALGYELPVDGVDGPATVNAVRDLQKRAGIRVDGIAGPATRAAIRQRLERRGADGKAPADKTLIDALRTPEGLATGGGILTTILSAASSPGPLQWAIAAVVVSALAIGIGFFVHRLRRAEA
ncbi:MAG: putative chitinase [Xanthobacteraceae bacterium]|jgi:hypothetical protein|nr:putative chitinase [Xanthobacteraceae bacterium]